MKQFKVAFSIDDPVLEQAMIAMQSGSKRYSVLPNFIVAAIKNFAETTDGKACVNESITLLSVTSKLAELINSHQSTAGGGHVMSTSRPAEEKKSVEDVNQESQGQFLGDMLSQVIKTSHPVKSGNPVENLMRSHR